MAAIPDWLQQSVTSSWVQTIRDLVTGTSDIHDIRHVVDECAEALPPSQFSHLLQESNIEGHTPFYCAIMNNRKDVLSAFVDKILVISPDCTSDMRLACMSTNNQALFSQLDLGNVNAEDKALRRILDCPPDEIQVDEKDTSKVDEHQFVASFRVMKFQKRLRTTHNVKIEFVAGGRIWWLKFYLGTMYRWRIACGLSSPSLPVCPDIVFVIKSQRLAKWKPGSPRQKLELSQLLNLVWKFDSSTEMLMPYIPDSCETNAQQWPRTKTQNDVIGWHLGEWVMYDDTVYVDGEGTLHGKLTITTMLD